MIRDFNQENGLNIIDIEVVKAALAHFNIDEYGLDDVDRKFVLTLINNFNGGPAGIEALAQIIGEEVQTLQYVNEPFLIQSGFITRTLRGRVATELAYKYFV